MRGSICHVAATVAFLWSFDAVLAQCPNITGNPAPQAEQYAANLVKLRYLNTGPGFNDDRPLLKKSLVQTGFVFDPLTTHNVHVTFRLNSATGPPMWSASIPGGSPLWTQTGNTWVFNDPLSTFGVRRAKLVDLGGAYLITYFRGRDANVINPPTVPGTDNVYVIVEFEQAGIGLCYGGITDGCTGSGNTHTCKVF